MPGRIIIMNNGTEQMLGLDLDPQQKLFAAKAALRNVWLAGPGDIIISRVPISADFESYVCRVLGFEPGAFAVISPDLPDDEAALADDLLLSQPVLTALQARISEPADWRMLACFQTEGTARLQTLLSLPDTVGRRFAAQQGVNLLNRKSHFRQFAVGAGLPLAEGAVASNPAALDRAIDHCIQETGKVIVKRDNGAGGTGNVVLVEGSAAPAPGACETLVRDSVSPEALWRRLGADRGGPLVVEAYHSARHMFYLEFYIRDDGGCDFLNSGAIRLRLDESPDAKAMFWVGLQLPAGLPEATLAEAMTHATRLARLAADIGYRGHINIDAIVTDAGALIFNEANARWGGGTVLHAVAVNLLGARFADTHVVSSYRDLPAPSFLTTLSILETHGLHYDAGRGEGILVLASDELFTHTIEALLIARTREDVNQLEHRLTTVLRIASDMAA